MKTSIKTWTSQNNTGMARALKLPPRFSAKAIPEIKICFELFKSEDFKR